jgi:hypothetical protein
MSWLRCDDVQNNNQPSKYIKRIRFVRNSTMYFLRDLFYENCLHYLEGKGDVSLRAVIPESDGISIWSNFEIDGIDSPIGNIAG